MCATATLLAIAAAQRLTASQRATAMPAHSMHHATEHQAPAGVVEKAAVNGARPRPKASTNRRIAVCLFGKIGDWESGATAYAPGVRNTSIETLATFAHSTVQRHILQANARDGLRVDVFLHSWNPEVSQVLDQLYRPNASLHEQPVQELNRVTSGHLSLERVMSLLRSHEVADDQASLVFVSRYDVVWFQDLLLRGLSPSRIWLPHHCQEYHGTTEPQPAELAAIESLCRSPRGALMEPIYARRNFPQVNERLRYANFNSMVQDFWFIASVEVAESFAAIYRKYDQYASQIQRLLGGYRPFATHFYWTHHISKLLRTSEAAAAAGQVAEPLKVGFTSLSAVGFNLARFFGYGSDCLVETSPVRANLSERFRDMRARLTPNPFYGSRPLLGLAYATPGSPSRHSPEGNVSWLANQCPQSLRSGRKLQCPWFSKQCSRSLQHDVSLTIREGQSFKRVAERTVCLGRPLRA